MELLAFAAKDALFLVDDFVPTGTRQDIDKLHAAADRLLRAQAGGGGRQRLRHDSSQMAPRPPRGFILCTGEDVPRGHSLPARLVQIDVQRDDVRLDRLTDMQRAGGAGKLASLMSAFVQWLAPRLDEERTRLTRRATKIRDQLAAAQSGHSRAPSNLGELAAGFESFHRFLVATGAVTAAEADKLATRVAATWGGLEQEQGRSDEQTDPALRFITLLGSAVSSGRAHIRCLNGGTPGSRQGALGWAVAANGGDDAHWLPGGPTIGWCDEKTGLLYLEPTSSYAAAKEAGRGVDDQLGLSVTTIRKRLRDRGLIEVIDDTRQTLTVRRVVGGARREVLAIRLDTLAPTPGREPTLWSGGPEHGASPDHNHTSLKSARGADPQSSGQEGQAGHPYSSTPPRLGGDARCVD